MSNIRDGFKTHLLSHKPTQIHQKLNGYRKKNKLTIDSAKLHTKIFNLQNPKNCKKAKISRFSNRVFSNE